MKRIGYYSLALLATLVLCTGLSSAAHATMPVPNGVKFKLNNWLTCPGSPVTTVDNYPSLVSIQHDLLICDAWAEQHGWRFSADGGATVAQYANASDFSFCATLVLTGSNPGAETGINLAPWWDNNMNDGRIQCRVPDGIIEVWGGRLPYYNFSAANAISFTQNSPISLSLTYHCNGLSSTSPGTVKYDIVWLGLPYSSGTLALDEGSTNPLEWPIHGNWGILNYGNAGGFLQARMDPTSYPANPAWAKATWTNICFTTNEATAATKTSWGQLKSLYR